MTYTLADWRPTTQPFTMDKELYELFQDIKVLCEMLDLKLHSFGDNNITLNGAGIYSWEISEPHNTNEMHAIMNFLYDKNYHINKVEVWEYQKLKNGFVRHEKESDKKQLQIVINKIKEV